MMFDEYWQAKGVMVCIAAARRLSLLRSHLRNKGKKQGNKQSRLVMDLLYTVGLYEIKAKEFDQYLSMKDLDPYHREKVQDIFTRDKEVLDNCFLILSKMIFENQSKFSFWEDVFNGNKSLQVIKNCKEQIEESMRNLATLMLAEKFEDESSSIPVNIALPNSKDPLQIEAKNFWIKRFGLLRTEVDVDTFTQEYRKYCMEIYDWQETTAVSLSTMFNIIKSTVGMKKPFFQLNLLTKYTDIGSQKDMITLSEFSTFVKRFGPMSESFLKIASICGKDGKILPWFAPESKLYGPSELNALDRPFELRLSSSTKLFTLEVFLSDAGATSSRAYRIDVSDKGMYFIPNDNPKVESRPEEFETLTELIVKQVESVSKKQIRVQEYLSYWRKVISGKQVANRGALYETYLSEFASAPQESGTSIPKNEESFPARKSALTGETNIDDREMEFEMIQLRLELLEKKLSKIVAIMGAKE